MLDNLRSQTSFQPDDEEPEPLIEPKKKIKQRKPLRTLDQITGMKASQRFVLSLMILITICLLGTILLVALGKVVLPTSF